MRLALRLAILLSLTRSDERLKDDGAAEVSVMNLSALSCALGVPQ